MSFDVAIRKRIGELQLDVEFSVAGGLSLLLGPSGAGKTSILNMVAGLMRPDAGRIRVGGTTLFDAGRGIDLPPERRRAGYVFQDSRLFPHRRVRDNLLYGYRLAPAGERWLQLDEAVAFLGIAQLLERWPASLSGGERRRVAIGRALLSAPRFLLLDEPLSFVDRARREEIITLIRRIRDDLALPVLYVTHDPEEARRLDATVVRL
jgi:molybdate transport system ATP-binding protein